MPVLLTLLFQRHACQISTKIWPPDYNLKAPPAVALNTSWLCVPSIIHSRHLNVSQNVAVCCATWDPVSKCNGAKQLLLYIFAINLHIHTFGGGLSSLLSNVAIPLLNKWWFSTLASDSYAFFTLVLRFQIPAISRTSIFSTDSHVHWENKDQKEYSESQQRGKNCLGQKSNPEMDNEKIHLLYLFRLLPSDSTSSLCFKFCCNKEP